jgi:NADPH:quinone reductase-like Zn-dependent oxidoreductase
MTEILQWKTRSPTRQALVDQTVGLLDETSMRPWLTTLTRSAIATMSSSATMPTDMKCVFYGDLNKVQTIPVPKHKPGHLLVQVKAVGLNPVDAKDVFGDKLPHSWSTGHAVIRWYIKDKIPGFDFAGVVVASSSSGATDEYQPGDKVYGTMPPFTGSLAEYVDAPLDQVCHMPENFSFEEAAATPLVW